MLSSRRQAKPTRGLKLFISVLIQRLGEAHLIRDPGAIQCDQTRRQKRGDRLVGHDVIATLERPEVRESQVLFVTTPR